MAEFEKESQAYKGHKEQWLKDGLEGQFALIKDDMVLGVFASQDDAYKAGLSKLGNTAMYIKRIQKDDPSNSAPAVTFGLLHAGP